MKLFKPEDFTHEHACDRAVSAQNANLKLEREGFLLHGWDKGEDRQYSTNFRVAGPYKVWAIEVELEDVEPKTAEYIIP